MRFPFLLTMYIVHIEQALCSVSCIKRSALMKEPLSLISPCHTKYDHSEDRSSSAEVSARRPSFTQSSPATVHGGYPAIFVGDQVHVSTDRFQDSRPCVSTSMLPAGTDTTEVTGAAFSGGFLHLLFGDRVVRVQTTDLPRWLTGKSGHSFAKLVLLPSGNDPVSDLATSPCCMNSFWCSKMGSVITAYTTRGATSSSSNSSAVSVILHVSEDEGSSYHRVTATLPAGSELVKFAQNPSQAYSSLFYNHAGRAHVQRMPHECHSRQHGCAVTDEELTGEELAQVVTGGNVSMLTALITNKRSLLVSARQDTNFQRTTINGADSLKPLPSGSGPKAPVKAFCVDGSRWVLLDADNWVFLGGSLHIWDLAVHAFQLDLKTPKSAISSKLLGTHHPNKTAEYSHDDKQPRGKTPPTPANKTEGGEQSESSASNSVDTYQLQYRVLKVLTVEERGSKHTLHTQSRNIDLAPHLSELDAECELFQLETDQIEDSQPVVDKNSTFSFSVIMRAALHLAVRPLVLLPLPLLVSQIRLMSRHVELDGSVHTNWSVAVHSHPENQRQPYMWRRPVTQLQVTSSVAVAECPAHTPRPVPVVAGCDPRLRLVALNKRVDKNICEQYKKSGLTIHSTLKGDPLLVYQQKLRGTKAVKKMGQVWHIEWDSSWDCPLLSSDKAEFEPVLAIKLANKSGWGRPLDVATAAYDIHGLRGFQYSLKQEDMGCTYSQRLGVSWRDANDVYFKQLKHNDSLDQYNPTWVLNTSTYTRCNPQRTAQDGDSTYLEVQPFFEIFGLKRNKIIWDAKSEPIYIFNFRVVDPLFTYCDLNLTIPVFYMHASDVSEDAKIIVLLTGVFLGIIWVLIAYLSQQIILRVRQDKQKQMDELLAAAELFATNPFNYKVDLGEEGNLKKKK